MESWYIDRIEGEMCVCISQAGEKKDIPRASLPEECGEGWSVLISEDGEILSAAPPDKNSIEKKRKRFHKLFGKRY